MSDLFVHAVNMSRMLVLAFWAAVALTYVFAIIPAPTLAGPDGDKINHILAFLTLAALGSLAYRRRPVWQIGLGLAGFGALIELTQMMPVINRDADVWDLVADVLAVVVGLALASALRRRLYSASTVAVQPHQSETGSRG